MTFWLFLLRSWRSHRRYVETREALRALDVSARADIGVTWLEIGDVARRASLRTAV